MLYKKCGKCNKVLPLTNEFFSKDKYAKSGFMSQCKECRKEYNKNYRRLNQENLRAYEKSRSKRKEKNTKRSKIKIMKDNPLQITYNSVHQYIKRHKDKPKYCMICNEKKSLQLACIDHKYTKNPIDYLWLCQSCHFIFDKTRKVIIVE